MNTENDIRRVVLEVVENFGTTANLQTRTVLAAVRERLRKDSRSTDLEEALLTCWYDLFRTGVLAWGYNLANPEPPFAHLTRHGRRALANLGRDPSNPDGYLAGLGTAVPSGSVAESYVSEALATYNAGCFKATAVMIGAAGEALVLGLRDDLVARCAQLGSKPPKGVSDWRIKTVLDALELELVGRSKTMPQALNERFSGYWSAFTTHLRLARNDAGHPKSVDPVTLDVVHGSLLIFPEVAKLVTDLRSWVQSAAFV